MIGAVLLSALFTPLAFAGNFVALLVALPLLGLAYATQDTLLKALLPEGQRNTAFGLFYIGYGIGWLIGSIAMGLLYDRSQAALIVFVVAAQLASVPLFLAARRRDRSSSAASRAI